jgi:hypothetical protein
MGSLVLFLAPPAGECAQRLTTEDHRFLRGDDMNPSQYIDRVIARHADWRGQTMVEIRRIIRETVPDVTEELKWMGTPTWSHNGVLCICKPFKNMVKVTFLNGAHLNMDAHFNAELDGTQWRAIKFFEGDEVDATGLKKLLLAAVAFNAAKGKGEARPATAKGHGCSSRRPVRQQGVLESGSLVRTLRS